MDVSTVGEILREALRISVLVQIIELRPQRLADLLSQGHQVVLVRQLRAAAGDRGQVLQDLEMRSGLVDRTWPSLMNVVSSSASAMRTNSGRVYGSVRRAWDDSCSASAVGSGRATRARYAIRRLKPTVYVGHRPSKR